MPELTLCVPNLTSREKLRYSTHVFTGVINDVTSKTIGDAQYSNYENVHFRCLVRVERVIKSECRSAEAAHCSTVRPQTDVLVYGWRASKRPAGFTGSIGLGEIPVEVGQRSSFAGHFLHRDAHRRGLYDMSFPAQLDQEGRQERVPGLAEYLVIMPNGLDDEALFPVEEDEL